MTEPEIERTSPPELADLPVDFWNEADVVVPPPKQAISLRVDLDVLAWFREQGPRYQTKMNGVAPNIRQPREDEQEGAPNIRQARSA